jgi:hypothetical protein
MNLAANSRHYCPRSRYQAGKLLLWVSYSHSKTISETNSG